MGDVSDDGSAPTLPSYWGGKPEVPVTVAMFFCFVACLPFWVLAAYLLRAWVS